MRSALRSLLLVSTLAACKAHPQNVPSPERAAIARTYVFNGDTIAPTGRSLGFKPDSISFSDRAMNSIGFLYGTITAKAGLEYALCLHGETNRERKSIRIKEVVLPFMIGAYHDSTSFNCDDSRKDFLGALHSHPLEAERCGFGPTDMRSFYRSEKSVIGVVACKNGMVTYVK